MYFSFLKQLTVTHVSWSPSTISSPVMSLIQPVETDCKQFSRAILLTKVFMFGFFKKSYIGGRYLICTDDTLKVWSGLVHPLGRRCNNFARIWPLPQTPLYTARARLFIYYVNDSIGQMIPCWQYCKVKWYLRHAVTQGVFNATELPNRKTKSHCIWTCTASKSSQTLSRREVDGWKHFCTPRRTSKLYWTGPT